MPQTRNQQIINGLNKPIVLIGMMGSGKTTLGRALAHALGLEFCDTDKIIEEKAGRPTKEIFAEYGEQKFRESEAATIAELLDSGKTQIIATGGGAIINPQTRQLIKVQSLSIWLQADIETLFDRVSKNQSRPLLQTENPKQTLKDLMDTRAEFYAQADLKFTVNGNSINPAVNEVLGLIDKYLS